MENHSYPDSRDSSPRSREIENENSSLDEIPSNTNNNNNNNNSYKVKFMCSYGGKILPRPHDNQLAYVGGDTKILAVDRNIKFTALMAKLSSLCNSDVCFKYQLPGEDLDALISVTNEEDLDHMMVEYDRLCRASARPARLRLFLFPLNASAPALANFAPSELLKPERQWFVDALNSVQIPPLEGSSPPPPPPQQQVSAPNPDFLFGLDKGYPAVPAAKLADSAPAPTAPDIAAKDLPAGSECGSEDPVVSAADIQRQIQELQRVQLGNNEQLLQQKSDEGNGRVYNMDYYSQKNPENVTPAPAHANAGLVPVPIPVSVQASAAAFLPERQMTSGGYPTGTEPPVYLIQTPNGMYQAVRPVTVPVGPAYYAVPRMVSAAEVYNAAQQASLSNSQSQPKIAYNGTDVGGVPEHGYSQVAYLPDMSAVRRQATAAPGSDSWN